MQIEKLTIAWKEYRTDELSQEDLQLVNTAKNSTKTSYSPYSNFRVGAALRLSDGSIVCGSNQENAAYPSGLCAERTAIFSACATKPDTAILSIAIAAYTDGHFTQMPITPCGACRQVMVEIENRYKNSIRIILFGEQKTMIFEKGISQLLPFCFGSESMK